MTYRITDSDLERLLKSINWTMLGVEYPEYNTPGAYELDYAYGGVRLVKNTGESGGQRIVLPRGTKRECFDMMRAFLAGLYAMKDKVKG